MNNKFHRGFTLLELLVAIGIFALVSAIAYGSLAHFMDDRARLDSEHAFWRGLSLAFARMEDDLSEARERTIRDTIGFKQPAFRGQPTDTRSTGLPSVEFTRGGVLTFDSGPRSDLQRVAYRLTDGTLKRLVWPVLDQGPQTTPQEQTLLSNVEDFRVRFYGPNGAWLDFWPATGINDILPHGVEVTLTLTGRGEFKRLFLVNG
ncbi:MAG TPA: type II secretion system minor pseudopilin GspJ [Candidatus Methylomirabilis sp.]|nr:type II secretion system minor pseudopilin GspJ [Candidatus Methylomirabilis sp.]